jgi:GNAT superfamily N-acetyltransferase
MRGDSDLAADADRNFIASYEKLAEHQPAGEVERFGSVFAFVSALPVSIFNGAVILEPPAPRDVSGAAAWLDERGWPYRFWIREELAPSVAPALEADGFVPKDWVLPGMTIRPDPPPAPSPSVTVSAIDEAALEEHVAVIVAMGTPEPIARSVCAATFVADPDARFFTAYLDGRPAGHSLAIRSGNVSGVYNVGTVADARRRGVGTAATWAAVEAGRQWGCSTVVLQSSEMGIGLYTGMGFKVVVRYVMFQRP